ncbi:hypothetical protein IKQ21_05450 [bacterium]|nr:hypothetical protein [bacterium]
MEVNNTSGAYSTEEVYGQLTAPFKPAAVTINAHTEFDDDEAVTYSQSDFHKNIKSFKYAKDEQEDNYSFGIDMGYKPNTVETGAQNTEFPPKTVFTFQNSSVSGLKDPVKGTLTSGYDYNKTLIVKNAKQAYSNAAGLTKDPVGALNQKQVEFKKPKSDFV